MKAKLFALLFLILFSFFSCVRRVQAPEPEAGAKIFTDSLGRRYSAGAPSERIVSLVPAITEILFAVGAGDRVVGVTEYCDWPEAARTKTSVGGFSGATVSFEQLSALRPGLVFLSADMHARVVALLDGLGIKSFAVEPRNFAEVYETIAVVGELTGCSSGATEVIAAMKTRIGAVEERVAGLERPAVFWVLSDDPLMTAGRETFISEAISLGGGRNIFDDVREQWPLVSPEQVLVRRPDWILRERDASSFDSHNQGHSPVAASRYSEFWPTVPAVRDGKVGYIDADFIYRYGPRLADAVEAIAEILWRASPPNHPAALH